MEPFQDVFVHHHKASVGFTDDARSREGSVDQIQYSGETPPSS